MQRHVVVTGGSSGIGAAAAALFRKDGARVTIIDRHDPRETADAWIEANLSDPDSISRIRVDRPVDALVNAAGLPPRPGQEAMILKVNTLALIALTEQLIDKMPEGASIVNMASKAGGKWRENLGQIRRLLALGSPEDAATFVEDEGIDPVRAYDLSKEAVIVWGMMNIERFRDRGLRVNSVSPAAVDTPILGDFMAAFGDRASRGVAITGRAGRPEEVAEVIRFLASPAASWVTGCNIECDGGLTAQLDIRQRLS